MRIFSSFAVLACLVLTTVGSAEAVTYGAITISVPVSVSAPPSGAGVYTIGVTCSSPKTSTYAGIAQVVNLTLSTAAAGSIVNGKLTFGPAPVPVPMLAGLQSGAKVTCAMTLTPPASETPQQYLSGLTYDSSKMTTQIALP